MHLGAVGPELGDLVAAPPCRGRRRRTCSPLRAATMARPTPVLPLVGSTMVPPGWRRPSRSACSIIASAGRSFEEKPGLYSSSLASRWQSTSRAVRSSRIIGVFPISSRRSSATSIGGPSSVTRRTGTPSSTTSSSLYSTIGSPRWWRSSAMVTASAPRPSTPTRRGMWLRRSAISVRSGSPGVTWAIRRARATSRGGAWASPTTTRRSTGSTLPRCAPAYWPDAGRR